MKQFLTIYKNILGAIGKIHLLIKNLIKYFIFFGVVFLFVKSPYFEITEDETAKLISLNLGFKKYSILITEDK